MFDDTMPLTKKPECNADHGNETLFICNSAVHEWEIDHAKKYFSDEGNISFLWRAHTVTVLVCFSAVLVYVALVEHSVPDREYNAKRGLMAAVLAFMLFGVVHNPDGPFVRPQPAFWHLILILSIIYELSLVFLLFQNVFDARHLMTHFDENLGKMLPEKDYGGNCLIYEFNHTNPWHNVMDKMDGFAPCHFFGWWLKTLVLRDWWLCTVLSVMFEVLEYTLEHQLPNFSECWWDHWIMDALVCNGLGIYFGMKTLNHLSMKPYHWRSMWSILSYNKFGAPKTEGKSPLRKTYHSQSAYIGSSFVVKGDNNGFW